MFWCNGRKLISINRSYTTIYIHIKHLIIIIVIITIIITIRRRRIYIYIFVYVIIYIYIYIIFVADETHGPPLWPEVLVPQGNTLTLGHVLPKRWLLTVSSMDRGGAGDIPLGLKNRPYLVGGLEHVLLFHILQKWWSQLTNIFQRVETINQLYMVGSSNLL